MLRLIFSSLLVLFIQFSLAQNIQKDIELGKQYSEYVEASVGIYDNPELTAYIKAVGDKLTDQMEAPLFDYKYTILATPEPNAFSIPGGHLYITTGMFPFLESEDELACIMAHEIIHANNRHVIKSNRKGILTGILQIPGAIIGAVVDENLGNALQSPFQQLGLLTHASYNRKQETEADLEGVEIAARAGYDPDALKSILGRIGAYGEIVSGEAEEKNAYASHPMTDDRVAKIDKLEPKLVRGETAYLTDDFLGRFDGVLAGSDPKHGVFVEHTFLNPTDNFKIVFPEDWESDFVGALIAGVNVENKEYMRVTYEESEVSPTDAANAYLAELTPAVKEAIIGSEAVTVGDKKGYIVAFKESSADEMYYGSKTWVSLEGLLFSFMAVSTSKDQSKMEEILYSLSSLSEKDIQSIDVPTLKLVDAQENETAGSIIARTKTELNEAVTLLINEKVMGELFQSGERVKVVVPEKL
jgi:predicted Zn-dependent protease